MPHAWNSLPDSQHKLLSLNGFKRQFKYHLIKISIALNEIFDVKLS